MTQTCVSLSTGTIRSDQRVNYAHGMVLGVDDFLTEQGHRLAKSALHERGLHGFGTVSGLQVDAERPADADTDVLISIAPGVAIDQDGRDVVIPAAQCVRLGAWLAAQELAELGTVAGHRGPSGELTVYVVLRYGGCLSDLVPLPGTPCSSSGDIAVASRITDAWDADLTFDRPPMPRWDTDRRLARLLGRVEIVAGLPPEDSDEDRIINAVLALPDRVGDGPDDLWPDLPSSPPDSPPSGTTLRLPAETAADALDRIFTVWVTQVRPQLERDLIDPGLDPAIGTPSDPAGPDATILLTTLTFLAANPFDPLAPAIDAFAQPDDAGRPYLLHTGLIQLLRSLQAAETTEIRPRELVSLAAAVDASGQLSLDAWFHLQRPVSLPDQLDFRTVAGRSGQLRASATDDAGNPALFSDRWLLFALDRFEAADGEQLEVRFDGVEVLVGAPAQSVSLANAQAAGLTLLNARPNGDVLGFVTTEIDEVGETPPVVEVSPRASVEFVTLTPRSIDDARIALELWFHPQPRGPKDDVFIDGPVFDIFDEVTGQQLPIDDLRQDPNYRNLWMAVFDAPEKQPRFPAYLRLLFRTKEMKVEAQGAGTGLLRWIEGDKILFIGWDPDSATIVAFTRVTGSNRQ